MSKSTPSLIALLGLVAVAGYQNRGRISEMLTDAQQQAANPGSPANGFMSDIARFFQTNPTGRTVSTALTDLVAQFRTAGQGDTAESWVSDRANKPVGVNDLEAALGNETLTELALKTGLTREQLLLRLNVALPDVVNRFTPTGQIPTDEV